MNNIIDGKLVRDIKVKELKEKVEKLDSKLTLAVISVGYDEPSKIYIKQKEKLAFSIGYNFLNIHYDNIEEDVLIKKNKRIK